jgi:hypothetical protein
VTNSYPHWAEYILERRNRYLLQVENAKALDDNDEQMMGEAVLEELNHLLTVLTILP